ncbi:hypothetical protein GM708_11805 [Vibrio cholerae]|nr:hypothetical protein [Vibrio cholerae]
MSSSSSDDESRTLQEQVRQAVDPTGERFALIDAVQAFPQLPEWLTSLSEDLAQQWSRMGELGAEYRQHLASVERILKALVPRGWNPLRMDSSVVSSALSLLDAERGAEADELLAGQWDGENARRTQQVYARMKVLGAGEGQDVYQSLFRDRARLILKAKEHHDAGRYEASIPIIQNQMEGLVIDITGGRKFFTSNPRQKANLVDPLQLVAVEACLAALQTLLGEGVSETQQTGSLSRHGVAHGRELAYDTRVNSAKYWSVLDALVEWARPLAAVEAQRRRRAEEIAAAGAEGVDEHGRRLDRREFQETRAMLRKLLTPAMSQLASPSRPHRAIVGEIYTAQDFVRAGLSSEPNIHGKTSADGTTMWFWRITASGWCLGAAVGLTDDGFVEWLYAGAAEPTESPRDAPNLWGDVFATPPDWTS